MDPIIRLAKVSSVARRIGRPPVVSVQQTVAEVVPASAPLPPEGAAVSETASASVPSTVAGIVPACTCGCADELARAVCEHEAALAWRDGEIASLREAAEQASIELAEAYTDAERRGYAAGEEKGQQAAGEAMREPIGRVTSLAREIGAAMRSLTDTAEDVMVDIAFTAVCRILGDQGTTRGVVRDVVRAAVASTREREQLVVRLHPDDVALLKNEEGDTVDGSMRISAESSVVLGGCIIDGPGGSLDARFETQLESLGAALKRARASRLAEQETV